MILNSSRASQFQQCRQKAWNWHELGLMSFREDDVLGIGEAYHVGSEVLTKTGSIEDAVTEAEARYRSRLEGQLVLAEERPTIERNVEFIRHAVRQWGQHYDKADFTVLRPEVEGTIPLPNTEHHCWFAHRVAYPNIPFKECPASLADLSSEQAKSQGLNCVTPHYFKFRTDGLIEMYKKIWILEQKTTSQAGNNNWWEHWQMEFQTTGYTYGAWKATGIQPHGFLLNAIIKHSKQTTVNGQRKYQLDPTNVGFEREAIPVTEARMLEWEREFILLANDYEDAFKNGKIYKNTASCFNYNRRCYYWGLCTRMEPPNPGEFRQRNPDYVDLEYYNLLGLKPPTPLVQITAEENNDGSL